MRMRCIIKWCEVCGEEETEGIQAPKNCLRVWEGAGICVNCCKECDWYETCDCGRRFWEDYGRDKNGHSRDKKKN